MATFNCNGGLDPTMHPQGASLLMDDLATHKISIAALQETHTREDCIFDNNDHHDKTNRGILYTIAGKNTNRNKTYGQGFYVDAAWHLQYIKHGYITDRISYIQFHVDSKKSKTLTIINAYAPTSQYKEEIVQSYYNELKDTHRRFLSKNNTVIIAGDFKEKLGSSRQHDLGEDVVGRYGKGIRNKNGNILHDFLTDLRLTAINTCFDKPLHRQITWMRKIGDTVRRNQIDYILLPIEIKSRAQDAAAKRTFKFTSDHNPVIMTINLKGIYKHKPITRAPQHYDYTQLYAGKWNRETKELELTEEAVKLRERYRADVTPTSAIIA